MLTSWGLLLMYERIASVIVCEGKRKKAFRLSGKNCYMKFVSIGYVRELAACCCLLLEWE